MQTAGHYLPADIYLTIHGSKLDKFKLGRKTVTKDGSVLLILL